MELSKRIKKIRIQKNLTQYDLAHACSVTRSAVANWESGRREPSLDTLEKIAHFFDMSLNELMGPENDESYIRNDLEIIDKKQNRLIFIVPIINTVLALIIIIGLLVASISNLKNRINQYDGYHLKDITGVSLQIGSVNKFLTKNFEEISTYDKELKCYAINYFEIKDDYFTKYTLYEIDLCLINVVIEYRSVEKKISFYKDDVNENEFMIYFDKTKQLYLTQSGIYYFVLKIKSTNNKVKYYFNINKIDDNYLVHCE